MSSPKIIPFARRSIFVWKTIQRVGTPGTIALLHAAFFLALQSDLTHQATQAAPKKSSSVSSSFTRRRRNRYYQHRNRHRQKLSP